MNVTSKKRYLERLIGKMNEALLLEVVGWTWNITKTGLSKIRL